MSTLDIIILVILAIGAFSGYRQGLFIGILSIVAFFVAIVMAFQLMDWGAEILATKVDNLTFMLPFIAFLIIFTGVVLIIRGLAFLVKKTLDFTILGSLDNVAGAVLGILKTGVLLSLLLWVSNSFEYSISKTWINESTIYLYIEPLAPIAINYLDEYTPIIKEAVSKIQELVEKASHATSD